mmetsp:Transcript_25043/g.41255  ORF Transcript_25043/g.41255 Transcript_25043/m.41255 type:complete len:183 (+) Transcript_25043:1299-1847(+)
MNDACMAFWQYQFLSCCLLPWSNRDLVFSLIQGPHAVHADFQGLGYVEMKADSYHMWPLSCYLPWCNQDLAFSSHQAKADHADFQDFDYDAEMTHGSSHPYSCYLPWNYQDWAFCSSPGSKTDHVDFQGSGCVGVADGSYQPIFCQLFCWNNQDLASFSSQDSTSFSSQDSKTHQHDYLGLD